MKFGDILKTILLGIVLSMFFFPVSFTFLPFSLNSKMMLAALGLLIYAWNCYRERTFFCPKPVLGAGILAAIFSAICYFSAVYNGTYDNSYATYIVTFFVWLFGAYAAVSLMRAHHGRVDLRLLTNYLTVICVVQCVAAQLNENVPAFKRVVDAVLNQGSDFMAEVGRIYGLGAALDPAGIKFSVVLVLMAHQLTGDRKADNSGWYVAWMMLAYVLIFVLGNVIARSTSVGAAAGIFYMFCTQSVAPLGKVSARQRTFFRVATFVLVITASVGIYLYNTNPTFHNDMRFAFEAFFNWVEHGEFRTDSTDKLNAVMWKWPDTTRGWVIGNGHFGDFFYSTDIGYCRFTLYCGLVGLSAFALYMIYNGLTVPYKFRNAWILAFALIGLQAIFWLKVATDVFYIFALLYCIDGDFEETE